MESKKHSSTDSRARAWQAMGKLFHKHFLCQTQLDWYELMGLEWVELSASERVLLIEVIQENPKFGPMFGLQPKAGVYANGCTVAQAYANDFDGHVFRTEEQQALVNGAQVVKPAAKIISFADYRERKGLENIQRNTRFTENR